MLRRRFFGTVIGLVAGSTFTARKVAAKDYKVCQGKLALYKRWIRALEVPDSTLKKFTTIHKTDKGEFIGPPFDHVDRLSEVEMTFWFKDLDITKSMNSLGFKIIDDEGFLITDKTWKAPIPCCNGDTLKTNYTLSVGMR